MTNPAKANANARVDNIPSVINVTVHDKEKYTGKGNDNDKYQRPTSDKKKPMVTLWPSFVAYWKKKFSALYESTVRFAAELIGDVLTHPRVHDTVISIIVEAINRFFDQEDIATKMDSTVRRIMYDRKTVQETSRALGEEVVPLMKGFVGGVTSSLTPAVLRKRRSIPKPNNDRLNSSLSTID
mmetsp:Transcript_24702/g.68198  ORF Transcript_24702/g.68198 Transcript_24702/m.68198 type:complete len:183 (+) Transcript_24702:185-733(+)